MLGRFVTYLADTVRRPRVELTRRQQQIRFAWELVAHCWRVLKRQRAEGMAAELTYRTIFSLIPLVVLGLVTFRAFGGLNEIEDRAAEQLYSFFGVPDIPIAYSGELPDSGAGEALEGGEDSQRGEEEGVESGNRPEAGNGNDDFREAAGGDSQQAVGAGFQITDDSGGQRNLEGAAGNSTASLDEQELGATPPSETPVSDSRGNLNKQDALVGESVHVDPSVLVDQGAGPRQATQQEVQASIRFVLRELTEKVSRVDFASIGVFGLLLFIYAAIALADSVENVFNLIYEAPSERPIHLRLAIHWSIITLGSALLAMSLYASSQLVDYLTQISGWSITVYANHALALLSGWILLFLLYSLMPNTHVSPKAAAVGSFVAALLWEVAKLGFQVYVLKAVPYSALYGSLGLIPLFLFWVYVTWFIILFGLVWTFTLQTAPGRVPTRDEDEEVEDLLPGDPQWLLPIMIEVAEAFREGRTVNLDELDRRLSLPRRILQSMADVLVRARLLLKLESETGDRFALARPAEQISLADVVGCGYYLPGQLQSRGWSQLKEYRDQQASREGQMLLSELLDRPVQEGKPDAID